MTASRDNLNFFIEREEPLSRIKQVFQDVDTKKSLKILFIKGDFGIGKTTLVEGFLHRLKQDNKNVIIGKASCTFQTQQNSLIPFKDILVNITNNEPRTKAIIGLLVNFLKEIAPAWANIVTAGAAGPVVEAVTKTISFGKQMGSSKYTQDNVYAQFANILKKLSEKNTLLLFLDDIQWIDETSLGLITYLSRVITNYPILLIAAYREADLINREDYTEYSTCMANLVRYGAQTIELSQGINTRDYIKVRYPDNDFPVDVVQKIEELSEGHPLFLDELFTYWEQIGLILEINCNGQKTWSLKKDFDIQKNLQDIPDSVTIIVRNRLQLMEKKLKDIISVAAVEGLSFNAQVISKVSKTDENEIFDSLEQLESNYSLIQNDREIDINDLVLNLYHFIRKFYREYIYSQIVSGKRGAIHREIAGVLEKIYGDEVVSIASKLIYHYREAHNFVKATEYCILGAKQEQANYGWFEAEKMCKEGLSLCGRINDQQEKDRLTYELLRISAKGLYVCGKVKLAHARYIEITNIVPLLNLSVEENLALLLDFIDACEDSNRISEARMYTRKVEEIIKTNQYDGVYKKQYIIYKSWDYIRTGKNKKAVDILTQLIKETDEKIENFWILAKAYNSLGIAGSNTGDLDSSNYLRKAAHYAEMTGDHKTETVALLNLADDLLYYYKKSEAESYNDRALALAIKIGDRDGEAYGLANKGRIELMNKNPEKAIRLLADCMVIQDEIGSNWNKSFVLSDMAVSYSLIEDPSSAFEMIGEAENYLEEDPFRLAYMLRSKANLLCNLGKPLESLDLFKKVVEICETTGDIYYKYETLLEYAAQLEKLGNSSEAKMIRTKIPDTIDPKIIGFVP